LSTDQQAEVLRAVDAYGKEGDANGVSVGIGSTKTSEAAVTTFVEGGFTSDANGNVKPNISAVFNKNAKIEVETVAHEGSHIADRIDFVNALEPGMSYERWVNTPQNLTKYVTEVRAYQVSSSVAQAQGFQDLKPGGYEIWNKGWKAAERNILRQQNIDKLLKGSSLYKVTPDNSAGPKFIELKNNP
jgi:hypothetical protein